MKVRGWKNIFHANGKQKKAGVGILISDKIDLKIKKITKVKEGHYIMIKGSVQEEDNNCKYLCTQHRSTSIHKTKKKKKTEKYIRQTLIDVKEEIDSNTVIVGDINTPPNGQVIKTYNKETQVLNDTLDEMDLIDTFRTFHQNAGEYTFFLSAHGTFSRTDHILSHKSNLSTFKKIEIIPSIFSNHNAMRLDINYKKKTVR